MSLDRSSPRCRRPVPAVTRLAFGLAVLLGIPGCSEAPEPEAPAPVAAPQAPWDQGLEKPVAGDPERAAQALQRAEGLRKGARAEEADRAYEEALAADPAHVPSLVARGYFLLDATSEKSLGNAVLCFRRARLVDPDSAPARWGEGLARQALGDHGAAAPLLEAALGEEVLRQDPERLAQVQLALGRIRYSEGRDEEARELLQAASEAPDRDVRVRALTDLAQAHADRSELDAARALLEKAVAEDAERLQTQYQLLRVLERQGDAAATERQRQIYEALRELQSLTRSTTEPSLQRRVALRQRLVELDASPRARRLLVRELLTARRYREAAQEVQKEAAAAGKLDAELLYLLARARAGQGDLDGAKQLTDSMRKLSPNIPAGVIHDILDEWRTTNPVDDATFARLVQQWVGG